MNEKISHLFFSELLEVDLVDVQNLKSTNNDVRFLLTVIDCFSRFLWMRPLKNKNGTTVASAMQDILENMKESESIKRLVSDRGSEFTSSQWRNLMQRYGIKHTYANTHPRFAERVQQSIQNMITMWLTEQESRTYIDVLPRIVETYNDRFHRMINLSPRRAELKKNHYLARLSLERHFQKVREKR